MESGIRDALRERMTVQSVVFWSSLAAAFLSLAAVAFLEAREVKRREHPLGGLQHVMIAGPVARALRRMLWVECVGIILAATAAVFEALS